MISDVIEVDIRNENNNNNLDPTILSPKKSIKRNFVNKECETIET